MTALTRRYGLPTLRLRTRFLLILFAIILLILVGQTLITLSREIADLDHRISTKGTILAQEVAIASVDLLDKEPPDRFGGIIERIRGHVDLAELSITDRAGRIVGHTDPKRIGQVEEGAGSIFSLHSGTSLSDVLQGFTVYSVSAPLVRDLELVGRVSLTFRSRDVSDGIRRHILSALGMGLFWLVVGGIVGTLYVRRIVGPVEGLTQAAHAISEDRLDEVEIDPPQGRDEVAVLQRSFSHLLEAIRAGRAENERLLEEQQKMNVRLQEQVEEMTLDLRKSAGYLESVIRCMEEGVITCDREGRIVQSNRGAFRQLSGLGEPSPGKGIGEIIPDGDSLAEAVRNAIVGGANTELEVERLVAEPPDNPDPSGASRTIHFRVHPLREDGESPLGALVTLIDQTEKRLLEVNLRRKDRLMSLGTMAAGLAHELGNCMHSIAGYGTLLLDSLDETDPRKADARTICDENRQAIDLLQRFLQFARPGEIVFHPEPIDTIVRGALDWCSYQARRKEVEVVRELGTDGLHVTCDARLLTQVFLNLILNAIDAVAGREERRLTVRSRVSGANAVIEVADTGVGIGPEQIDRIFDPFYTTKEATGTGLGLSIAQRIIHRHQGSIDVRSEPGVGTTFTVTLPVQGPAERSEK